MLTYKVEWDTLWGMARPFRILVAGGWYHVTSRGNRREAMRWLHVSYSSRFNWAHGQCGHVFQGRYRAIVVEDQRGVVAVARYVHLNPVRVGRLGLDKAQQRLSRAGGAVDPGVELVRRRLQALGAYPWSSWRVYSGAEPAPGWLETGVIGAGCGGRSREERRRALREYTEAPLREGRMESPWAGLIGGVVLGGKEFAQALLGRMKPGSVDAAAQTSVRQIKGTQRIGWAEIVAAAEGLRGKRWSEMAQDWGDWGRDGTLYVAVRHGRQRLADVVRAMGGLKYAAAAQGVRRFASGLGKDGAKVRFVEGMKRKLCETRRGERG